MRTCVVVLLVLGLATPAALKGQQPAKKLVATDPAQAGPDYAVQGEYVGETATKAKLGAEVVARGGGSFLVNFLPGGLRGDGGDYAKRVEGSAKTEGDKTAVTTKDSKWTATIAAGQMTGTTAEGQAFTLERVVRQSKTLGEKPPAGAVVLFDGKNTDEWNKGQMVDGHLLGNGTVSKRAFGDHKIHLEFRLSFMPFATGQARSNSGVYVQHRHEVQVLDSFGLKGAANECGALYGQAAPKINLCYPPLQWQTYDIEFRAARFDAGKPVAPAVISVWHNGVLVHDKVELKAGDGKPGPLHLQSHGGQVQYRNIWVVETGKAAGEAR